MEEEEEEEQGRVDEQRCAEHASVIQAAVVGKQSRRESAALQCRAREDGIALVLGASPFPLYANFHVFRPENARNSDILL